MREDAHVHRTGSARWAFVVKKYIHFYFFKKITDHLHYITFSHLGDAFIQSDLQMEDNGSNQNLEKSNDMQVL